MLPAFMTSPEFLCDAFVAVVVLGAIVQGAKAGLFRATVASLVAITVFFLPLALVNPLSRWLTRMDLPPGMTPILAFLMLLVATTTAIRRLTSCLVPPQAMRLPPVLDIIGGSALGAVAGTVLAGTVLVAGSILPIPPPFRINTRGITFDAGGLMLGSFISCVEGDRHDRATLLGGEPLATGRRQAAAAGPAAAGVVASEPFIDKDGNGRRDDGESFLDIDGNMIFSTRLLFADHNANGRRDIGLLERYHLGFWHLVTQMADTDDDDRRPTREIGRPLDDAP